MCPSKFPTILNLLDIENVNVLNFLIEQKKVGRVIITDQESAFTNLLKSVETSPSNLLYALTINRNGSGITQWYPAPNFRSYSVTLNPRDFGKLQTSGLKYLGIMPWELPWIMPVKTLKSESGANKTKTPYVNGSLGDFKSKLIPVKKQRKNLRATKLSYGEKITKLVSEIKKNQDKFKKLPIGPINMEVKVKENVSKEFVEGIETELGKLLLSFLVDNNEDKGVVVGLAKDVDVDITVIVSKYSERLVKDFILIFNRISVILRSNS